MVDAAEQIEKFKEFIEEHYKKKLHELIRKGKKALVIDFSELARFDPGLAEQLLEEPDEVLKAAEISLEQFDVPSAFKWKVRVHNLPDSQKIRLRDIRSEHLGKFIAIEGYVRQASEVRPQVVSARFECPSCASTILMLQLETSFREPSRCTCGRKGKFRLLSKDLIDAQRLVIEEAPESLEGGEQPKRLSVFLKGDLVEPIMERKTTPGSKVKIVGFIQEVPVFLKTGVKSVRYDLIMECNFIESIEEIFETIEINKEDEKVIKKLAKDPRIDGKLINSIAPSIYGHEDIKEALVLQLMGGIKKERGDGTKTRGDLHVLLVGDPGAAKCVNGDSRVILADGTIDKISNVYKKCRDKEQLIDDGTYKVTNHDIVSLDLSGKLSDNKATVLWKRESPNEMYKVKTITGKEIIVTPTHPFFICENGKISAKSVKDVGVSEFIATPRILRIKGKSQDLHISIRRAKTNGTHIKVPKKTSIELCKILGYLLAEGHLRKSESSVEISFTNSDKVLLDDFKNCMKKIFGGHIHIERGYRKKNCEFMRVSSVELGEFFEKIAPTFYYKSNRKEIPYIIPKCSNDEIRYFLRAYFDGEASPSIEKGIYVCSANRILLEDVQILLLRFGILSQLHSTVSRATNTKNPVKKEYFRLAISGENVKKFNKEIGFGLKRKEERVRLYFKNKRFNTNLDVIPNLSNIFRKVRKSLMLTQFDMGMPRASYQHYERGDRNPSRKKLGIIVKSLKTAIGKEKVDLLIKDYISSLRYLSESDIFWDKIVSKKKITNKNTWVYDLQVNNVHNFLANNFVIHNSSMLMYMSKAAPKARYVAGRSVTGAGITASVVKDEFLRGWALEAGALVLANKGVLCLDEMDKMGEEDTSALHEAMSQQQISISKANIQATLKAETTLLAAANPKFGRFDPYKPIASQIALPPALINRFDLIFSVRDLPNKMLDGKIATHVLELHQNVKAKEPEIEVPLLKKYVAYVRQKVFPVLTDEAVSEIKNFYVNLRNSGAIGEDVIKPIPISARQLEALVRLAEASARIRLSDKVTKADSKRAIKILKYCLMQVGIDPETGRIDIDRIATGITASQRSKIVIVREIINSLEAKGKKQIPIEDVIYEAAEKNLDQANVEEVIDKLKGEGEIFEPSRGFISKI